MVLNKVIMWRFNDAFCMSHTHTNAAYPLSSSLSSFSDFLFYSISSSLVLGFFISVLSTFGVEEEEERNDDTDEN
jgi:hypothetical protein